ncbi:hypothetical protein [Bengtsoniella intestinalis]
MVVPLTAVSLPQGERGLKSFDVVWPEKPSSRSPQGERGLKSFCHW